MMLGQTRLSQQCACMRSPCYGPDILCMAKGLTGGYAPLSAVAFREPVGKRARRSLHLRNGTTSRGDWI